MADAEHRMDRHRRIRHHRPHCGHDRALPHPCASPALSRIHRAVPQHAIAYSAVLLLFWPASHGFSITPECVRYGWPCLHGGAYMADRSVHGLETVEPIQRESAISLGLSKLQSMRYVVLPQAVSLSFPSFVANVIFLLKETSVFSAISLMDLMFVTKDLMGLYYKTTECLVMLVAFYLIILVPVSVAGTYIERRLRHGSFGA